MGTIAHAIYDISLGALCQGLKQIANHMIKITTYCHTQCLFGSKMDKLEPLHSWNFNRSTNNFAIWTLEIENAKNIFKVFTVPTVLISQLKY
jgi:hypothetical protein